MKIKTISAYIITVV